MKKFNLLACAIIISVTANSHANNKELNARGIMCDRIEFDELNTYCQEDLEALYCSYKVGHKIADETMTKEADKHKGTSAEIAILQRGIQTMELCSKPMIRISDLLKRKYSGSTNIRCEKYKGYTSENQSK